MKKLNFLEKTGVIALALPVVAALGLGVLLATGTIRIYVEDSDKKRR